MTTEDRTFELQLWVPKLRAYEPALRGGYKETSAAFNALPGTPRRLVLVDKARPVANPKYRKPPASRARGPRIDGGSAAAAYIEWARRKGLKQITIYRGQDAALATVYGLAVRYVDPEPEEITAEPDGPRYRARFTAQAWQGDYAVTVDACGPVEWDCTDYMRALPDDAARAAAMKPDYYPSDRVRDDPAAPEWVRQWAGPYYVTVTEEIEP